ncbi:MAG: pyridoxamine 5'-phosphate oxidase [Thermoanaerobaculia bacterium]
MVDQYEPHPFLEDDLAPDPVEQFRRWYDEVMRLEIPFHDGVVVSTATPDGVPSSRTVLLKSFDQLGFVFFTNYRSRKGDELALNPRASMLFWWKELGRQVRIEGTVEMVTPEESDAYFASRPRGSQIGAWASEQSEVLATREQLEDLVARFEKEFEGREVPRPPHWGGYRIVPSRFEFWQGQPSRLHDRLVYAREPHGWRIERLAP